MSRQRHDAERLRAALLDVDLTRPWRIPPSRFADRPLGCVPAPSRFSDPALEYAVLYVGSSVRCALWEALLRDRFLEPNRSELPVELIKSRSLATIVTREPLRLLDLRGDGTTRVRVPTAVTRDRRHAAGRALSSSLYTAVPEADGIVYDSRFLGEACAAVFDRALQKLEAFAVTPLVSSAEVRDALAEDDITLIDQRPR